MLEVLIAVLMVDVKLNAYMYSEECAIW